MTATRAAALATYSSDADLRAAKMRMGEALPAFPATPPRFAELVAAS